MSMDEVATFHGGPRDGQEYRGELHRVVECLIEPEPVPVTWDWQPMPSGVLHDLRIARYQLAKYWDGNQAVWRYEFIGPKEGH